MRNSALTFYVGCAFLGLNTAGLLNQILAFWGWGVMDYNFAVAVVDGLFAIAISYPLEDIKRKMLK